jgi:hypothetical protein
MIGVDHVGLERPPRPLLVSCVKCGKRFLRVVNVNHESQNGAKPGREGSLVVVIAGNVWGSSSAIDWSFVSKEASQRGLAQRLMLILNDVELSVLPLVHIRAKAFLKLS